VKGNLKIHLKPKERIFINGAVVRVDRKVTLDLLNDVAFLLECHFMKEEDATTPLRQLYFVIQSMLIEPQAKDIAIQVYHNQHRELVTTQKDRDILEGLVEIRQMVEANRPFDALKRIRALYPLEGDAVENAETQRSSMESEVA